MATDTLNVNSVDQTRRIGPKQPNSARPPGGKRGIEASVSECGRQLTPEPFGALADAMPEIVWTAQPDGSVDYYNQRWFDFTALTLEQTRGWGWRAVLHPEDLSRCVQRWTEAVRTEQPFECECRLKRGHDNAYRSHLSRATPVRGDDGRVIKWVGASTDIEDQRRAESTLHAQAAALREQAELLDLAYDGILVRNTDGRITFWNHGAQQLYGFAQDEALGQPAATLLKTEYPKPLAEIEAELLRKGRWEGALVHHRKDGSRLIVDSRWALRYDEHRRPNAILEINSDVTERHRAELELQASTAELTRSNRELELFAYVASHDLQEPLRMVASYTQLLAREYSDQLDDRARKFIAFATNGALRMQSLINDLLAYSRVGTAAKVFQPVNSNDAFQTALKNLEITIREKSGVIRTTPLPMVMGDETQLIQLFQNLLSNALKFHGNAPPDISVTVELQGSQYLFAVRDRGIGIDPKYHDRIFVVFQRLHRREEFPGTGIGLAICRRIVERHGGKIWVESAPEKGATFWFTLPSVQPTRPQSLPTSDPAA